MLAELERRTRGRRRIITVDPDAELLTVSNELAARDSALAQLASAPSPLPPGPKSAGDCWRWRSTVARAAPRIACRPPLYAAEVLDRLAGSARPPPPNAGPNWDKRPGEVGRDDVQ